MMKIQRKQLLIISILSILLLMVATMLVTADPMGAEITSNTTPAGRSVSPSSRQDEGGTFTTLLLTAIQQNHAWKAYVGNVSGSLVLDDVNNKSIYEWSLTSTTGEIFASRAQNPVWGSITCATNGVISSEQTTLNMGATDIDNINNTFSATNHKDFVVAGTTLSSCRSNAFYVNDTAQVMGNDALFQQILISDSSSNLIYSSSLEDGTHGYHEELVDFQLMIPDNSTAGQVTTYYFFVELDS